MTALAALVAAVEGAESYCDDSAALGRPDRAGLLSQVCGELQSYALCRARATQERLEGRINEASRLEAAAEDTIARLRATLTREGDERMLGEAES